MNDCSIIFSFPENSSRLINPEEELEMSFCSRHPIVPLIGSSSRPSEGSFFGERNGGRGNEMAPLSFFYFITFIFLFLYVHLSEDRTEQQQDPKIEGGG